MIDVERFIDGYIECALWADCFPYSDAEDGSFDGQDIGGRENLELRPGAREKMAVDCRAFCEANKADLIAFCELHRREEFAGQDFWLTRSGHGTGFWDRGLGELGERLSEAARAYGSPDDHTPFDCGDGTADV